MAASPESEPLAIRASTGVYEVRFSDRAIQDLNTDPPARTHFIVDSRVAALHQSRLAGILGSAPVLLVEANEPAKSLDRFPAYVESLLSAGVKRDHTLVAIGGGVIQDITSFLAAT